MENRKGIFISQLIAKGIHNPTESRCDEILSEYAKRKGCYVACPYKPNEYLTGANKDRMNVHLATIDIEQHGYIGVGSIAFGDCSYEAKLAMIYSFLNHEYFKITPSGSMIILH